MCDSGGGSSQNAGAEELYRTQAGISKEMFANWKSSFQPLEKQQITAVNALSDPNIVEQRVGQAQEDVSQNFTSARNQQMRQAQGYGLNPADGMYTAGNRAFGLAEAGARAGAANRSRDVSRGTALDARMNLINTGRGISSQAQAGLSNAAGGLAGLGAQQQQQANANNAATGQALGTAAAMAAAYFGF